MAIFDNNKLETSIGEYLRKQLFDCKMLRIVSSYFTIYAYEALRNEIENIGGVRFLFGDPSLIGEVDPGESKNKSYNLNEDGLLPNQILQQKRIAKDCEKWIENCVSVRTIKKENFLYGKMYHFGKKENIDTAIVGSSNFTHRGLGFNAGTNLNLNVQFDETDACDELKQWFDDIWKDEKLTKNVKKEVLAALRRLGENCSPELIYFKTLLEVFRERMNAREETDGQLDATNLKDTKVWKTLYQFQRDGVVGIINRLHKYKGCILADSVGLGKTYTALAVIHYYEAKNQRVLVLCPKRLSENWKLYPAQFNQQGNPFKDDRFYYTVLHHTDLSRYSGDSNGIQLGSFDWNAYGLVVIDESHNFRNESSSERDNEGKIIRHSRYERLLQDIIQDGGETKVLMLSATPVNTSLDDLRNQINFITGKKDNAFINTLGISNIRTMLSGAQKQFKQWEQTVGVKDKRELFNKLGSEFFTLLDAISIARSRRHVKKFYPEVVEKIGGFPIQSKPVNKNPETDINGELSYIKLNEEINRFKLAIYTPATYIVRGYGKKQLEKEKERLNFNQTDRERWLIGMIRVNFLKRLESSTPALMLTLERTIKKIDTQIKKINHYENLKDIDNQIDTLPDDDHEDEDFLINKARHPLYLNDLDLERWEIALHEDKKVLHNVYNKVAMITPDRDGKLIELKSLICDKLKNPPTSKDGKKNCKVLIFTAFKDTAIYLYKELDSLVKEHKVKYAMVAGNETKTTYGNNKFNDILTNFAPIGRMRKRNADGLFVQNNKPEIDILIATDCVSEGQNLQDCDLVVNYDIHWNPVRLIQRFGRIDRIGSLNKKVGMVNFWPTKELDDYLNLQNRVEARMALLDAAATGDEDALIENKVRNQSHADINFRDAQIHHLYDGSLEFEEFDDGIALTDFSLDDFLAQLMNYLEQNRIKLEETPFGVYAVASCTHLQQESIFSNVVGTGVIFCLKQKNASKDRHIRSPLNDYYMVYIREDGDVRYNYMHAKQILEFFGELSRGQSEPLLKLCDSFDSETDNGKDMNNYNDLLIKTVDAISKRFGKQEVNSLKRRDAVVSRKSEQPLNVGDFELITWLVIKDEDAV